MLSQPDGHTYSHPPQTDSHPHKPTHTHSHTATPPPLFLNLHVRLWNLLGWLPGDCCLLLEYWSYPSPPAPFLSFHLSMSSFHPFNLEVWNNTRMRARRKHTLLLPSPDHSSLKVLFLFIYLPRNKRYFKRSWDFLVIEMWYTSVDPSSICCNHAKTTLQKKHNILTIQNISLGPNTHRIEFI